MHKDTGEITAANDVEAGFKIGRLWLENAESELYLQYPGAYYFSLGQEAARNDIITGDAQRSADFFLGIQRAYDEHVARAPLA